MKKSIIAAGVLVLSQAAIAAPIVLGTTPETQLNPVSCPNHVDANVALNPSNNVKLAFNCVATGNINTIKLGTCHTAGLVKSRSEKVSCGIATGDDPSITGDPNEVLCDATGDTTTYKVVTKTGATFFVGQTGGGSAGAADISNAQCDTAGASVSNAIQ